MTPYQKDRSQRQPPPPQRRQAETPRFFKWGMLIIIVAVACFIGADYLWGE